MAEVQVLSPRGVADVQGQTIAVSSIVMNLVAGGVSTCQISAHDVDDAQDPSQSASGSSGKAVDALSLSTADKLSAQQALMFEQTNVPNSKAIIYDGAGKSIVFHGFMSSPGYGNAPGVLGNSYMLMHQSIMLSSYRSFIYPTPRADHRESDITGDIFLLNSKDMATRFIEVLEILVKRWDLENDKSGTPFSVAQKVIRHKQNEVIFPRLKAVMEASTGASYWPSLTDDSGDHPAISAWIAGMLSDRVGDFFNTLAVFEQDFQCMFVPQFDAPIDSLLGRFVSYESIGSGGTGPLEPLTVPVEAVQFAGGNRTFLPITHAIVSGTYLTPWRSDLGNGNSNTQVPELAVFPESFNAAGLGITSPGPPWMTALVETDVSAEDAKANMDALDLDTYETGRVKIKDFIQKVNDKVKRPILDTWARNIYIFSALSGAICTINTPLNVAIKPGRRHAVLNKKGEILFNGFLAQVSHRVSAEGERSSASTSLSFTHVEASGFNLPL